MMETEKSPADMIKDTMKSTENRKITKMNNNNKNENNDNNNFISIEYFLFVFYNKIDSINFSFV